MVAAGGSSVCGPRGGIAAAIIPATQHNPDSGQLRDLVALHGRVLRASAPSLTPRGWETGSERRLLVPTYQDFGSAPALELLYRDLDRHRMGGNWRLLSLSLSQFSSLFSSLRRRQADATLFRVRSGRRRVSDA